MRPLLPLVVLAALRETAHAAGPLPAQNEPLRTSRYDIDFFQGPVLASGRITGLAGAYEAIAWGADGEAVSAAAPTARVPWSYDHFDYDWTAGFTLPSSIADSDFDNNGSKGFSYRDFVFFTLGANLQFGNWGVGVILAGQSYQLGQGGLTMGTDASLSATLGRGSVQVARSFGRGQLLAGVGLRFVTMGLSEKTDSSSDSKNLLDMSGLGAEGSVLWCPQGLPFRGGLTVRSPVQAKVDPASNTQPNDAGDVVVGSFYLPSSVVLPWEVEVGLAYQVGPRPLNFTWSSPHEDTARLLADIEQEQREREKRPLAERAPENDVTIREDEDRRVREEKARVRAARKAYYLAIPRQYLLVSASLLLSGKVSNAVGLESFLRQVVDRSGENLSVTPRIGLESELLPNQLTLRAGSYLEPSRFAQGSPRVHATAGMELKLLSWTVFGIWDEGTYWKVGGFVDEARDYFGWGATVGIWH